MGQGLSSCDFACLSPKHALIKQLTVVPYGVLGTQHVRGQPERQVAPPPDGKMMFVDPAGLHHIQGSGPAYAGGASGSIYRFLGINNDPEFPEDVWTAIEAPCDAKLHAYELVDQIYNVVHVVGPDFNPTLEDPEPLEYEVAVEVLARAYTSVLTEAVKSAPSVKTLRLLPISGAIFAGPFISVMPSMTMEALAMGYDACADDVKKKVLKRNAELCIFAEKEFPNFTAAQEAFLGPKNKSVKTRGVSAPEVHDVMIRDEVEDFYSGEEYMDEEYEEDE
jgi:hypothetical protein